MGLGTQVVAITQELLDSLRGVKFPLFGFGNEKRDIHLLVRGHVQVESVVDIGFFGCMDCGHRMYSVRRMEGGFVQCSECEGERIVWIEGVAKGMLVEVVTGCNDGRIKIKRL